VVYVIDRKALVFVNRKLGKEEVRVEYTDIILIYSLQLLPKLLRKTKKNGEAWRNNSYLSPV